MEPERALDPSRARTRYRAARSVVVIAAVFCLVVGSLIVATYLQLRTVDPLNSPAVDQLIHQLRGDPQNQALQEQIRALDLLARKAYFTSRWQLRTGGWLLLGGIVVLAVAARAMHSLRKELAPPGQASSSASIWREMGRARTVISVGGGALLVLAAMSALLFHGSLDGEGLAQPKLDPATTWPGFRGPSGNAVAAVSTAPLHWDVASGAGIAWKTEVPLPGNSSPVILGEQVFLTGADRKTQEVYSFSLATGELQWRTVVAVGETPAVKVSQDTGYAAPTMTTDGRNVFAIFATGDLVCLDTQGKILWGKNLGKPKNHYGHASSLITFGNLLIVQWDQSADGRIFGLQAASGEIAWQVNRTVISWSSPIVVDTGNRWELILTNSTSVDSFDPKTGVKLWGLDCLSGEMGPSAAAAGDMVFAANDYAVAVGIKVGADSAEVVWEYDEYLPDAASPVAAGGYVFLVTSYGLVVCLDAATGKMVWEQEYDNGCYSSPVVVGELVYTFDLKGVMHVFKVAAEYEAVAEATLGEDATTTPAFVQDRLVVRGSKHLFCISGSEGV